MRLKTAFIALMTFLTCALTASAVEVTVKMNAVSTTMSMKSKATGEDVAVGDVNKMLYTFTAPPGDYVITGYAKDGKTVNGTIDVCVGDSVKQQITVLTLTAYVSNKTNGTTWTVDNGDYTIDVKVNSREGVNHPITLGESVTAGRKTFLALNGDTYSCAFIPSKAHADEGYLTLYKQATLTGNVNVSGAIPQSDNFTVTVPKDATFELNMKFFHFIDFTRVDPVKEVVEGDFRVLVYRLAHSQVYNYRTSMPGKLTQGGYFTMNKDVAKRPVLMFTKSDYEAFGPKTIKHDVQANEGFETGDIFVNVNKEGYLDLNVGDTFLAHAMRTWQLTENSTNNYFIEPDFHYTIIDTDGKESDSVIRVEQKEGSAWASLKAVGAGTAIVLVTYDAIGLNFYASSTGVKQAYMGGEYWSAIWPENTAAYVITVGQGKSAVDPQMLVNEKYNQGALKVAGNYVDAEHDVFYYLDTEEGYSYTFRADGANEVKIAYPVIGEQMATYSGFGDAGVTANADGSYTVLLKEGRQIVRMTDASGKSAYQVFTAKKCHREIVNVNRPGSKIFQPGDKLAIQYSGLRHPANKLAGIYNMSAYVTYNGVPNGTSLILSANQYKFGSSDKAQAVTLDIPADHDVAAEPELTFTEGVIQVNGYGDPIGNHRIIDPRAGRSPNFAAVPHKTYFGAIPDVRVPVTAVRNFPIKVDFTAENGKVTVSYLGKELEADDEGLYEGTYGFYDVVATAPGNRCQRLRYNIPDDAEGLQTFNIEPVKLDDDWFGTNSKEPATDADGRYVISSASELAWFRDKVNAGDAAEPLKATLTADIDLGDYDWTPIGDTSHPFTGEFTGNGHTVRGLYIDQPRSNMLGLFGSVKGTDADHRAHISGVTVYGYVNGNMTLGGLAAHVQGFADIDACANYAEIHGARNGVGGLIGALTQKTSTVTNCYNAGSVFAESTRGGIVGNLSNGCDVTISNVFNVGVIEDHANGHAIAGSTYAVDNITNAYAIADYAKTGGYTLVTEARMASGEIAYRLGSAFGQKIGEDAHPVFSDDKVYKVTYSVVDAVAAAAEDEGLTLYSNADLPTRIGEQEVLWYADAALTQPVTVIDADSRLYVKNLYTYTLTYVLDGETYKEETHYEGEAIAPEADPVREGYTFSGWEGVPEVMPAGNVTVTGSFAVNSYRLTLYLNNEVYKDEMLEYGAAVVVDEPEVPEGCRFDGWTDAIPATMPAHDVDIHGTYTELSGIAGILVDADEKVTVCTPSGIVLYADRPWGDVRDTLAPGVYIVRSAAAVTKVCVK